MGPGMLSYLSCLSSFKINVLPHFQVRVAAGRTAARLAAHDPRSQWAPGAVAVLGALIGPDQTSGVQQQV